MIAVDTNILVHAHVSSSPWNDRAYTVIEELAASGTPWAIPWHCIHECYAIVTHPKIYRPATSHAAAIAQIDAWIASPSLTLLYESPGTWPLLRALLAAAKLSGPRVYDARIAAVCLEHGVTELWSADRDFSRFPSLRVRNPLVDLLPTRAGERRAIYQTTRRGRPRSSVQRGP